MAGLLAYFRPHRRDGLHIDLCIWQCLAQHVQHQPVIGQKAAIIGIAAQHVGAQQNINGSGLLGGQRFQRHLSHAVGALAGGAVDDHVRPNTLVRTEHGVLHSFFVQLHALRQAVAHKAHVIEPFLAHSRAALWQRRHTEIQRSGRAVCKRLHRELPRHRVGGRVPSIILCYLLQDGVLPNAGGPLFPVQALPQHPDGSHQQKQQQQSCRHEPPAPAFAQHAPPVFLIVCHAVSLTFLPGLCCGLSRS